MICAVIVLTPNVFAVMSEVTKVDAERGPKLPWDALTLVPLALLNVSLPVDRFTVFVNRPLPVKYPKLPVLTVRKFPLLPVIPVTNACWVTVLTAWILLAKRLDVAPLL